MKFLLLLMFVVAVYFAGFISGQHSVSRPISVPFDKFPTDFAVQQSEIEELMKTPKMQKLLQQQQTKLEELMKTPEMQKLLQQLSKLPPEKVEVKTWTTPIP